MAAATLAARTTLPVGPAVSSLLHVDPTSSPAPGDRVFVSGWVGGPSTRGTWSLVYACAFTIGLCVWTAIHPNIPAPSDGRWVVFRRKLKWVFIALLTPEVVLAVASQQLYRAWHLRGALRKKAQELRPRVSLIDPLGLEAPAEAERKSEYLAKVGSIPAESYDMTYCFYVVMGGFLIDLSGLLGLDGSPVALTDLAIHKLADRGYFLKMTTEAIMDKSKADLLAKGLAILQVSWLVVQSIARAVEGLPLTLLEIHNMSHVAAAVCMYGFWWHKPKDVSGATIIDSTPLLADLEVMVAEEDDRESELERRWRDRRRRRGRRTSSPVPSSRRITGSNRYFKRRMSNFHLADHDGFNLEDYGLLLRPMLLAAGYAAIHMTATPEWGAREEYFPTSIEGTLWRAAGYTILGTSALYFIIAPLSYLVRRANLHFKSTGHNRIRSVLSFAILMPIFILAPIAILLVISSRLYLIVESFVSIRIVPLEVYALPDWTLYLPHF